MLLHRKLDNSSLATIRHVDTSRRDVIDWKYGRRGAYTHSHQKAWHLRRACLGRASSVGWPHAKLYPRHGRSTWDAFGGGAQETTGGTTAKIRSHRVEVRIRDTSDTIGRAASSPTADAAGRARDDTFTSYGSFLIDRAAALFRATAAGLRNTGAEGAVQPEPHHAGSGPRQPNAARGRDGEGLRQPNRSTCSARFWEQRDVKLARAAVVRCHEAVAAGPIRVCC
jgi:hypothetical protein